MTPDSIIQSATLTSSIGILGDAALAFAEMTNPDRFRAWDRDWAPWTVDPAPPIMPTPPPCPAIVFDTIAPQPEPPTDGVDFDAVDIITARARAAVAEYVGPHADSDTIDSAAAEEIAQMAERPAAIQSARGYPTTTPETWRYAAWQTGAHALARSLTFAAYLTAQAAAYAAHYVTPEATAYRAALDAYNLASTQEATRARKIANGEAHYKCSLRDWLAGWLHIYSTAPMSVAYAERKLRHLT